MIHTVYIFSSTPVLECTGAVTVVSDGTVNFFKDALMCVRYAQKVLIRCPLLKKDTVVRLMETVFSGSFIHIWCPSGIVYICMLIWGNVTQCNSIACKY